MLFTKFHGQIYCFIVKYGVILLKQLCIHSGKYQTILSYNALLQPGLVINYKLNKFLEKVNFLVSFTHESLIGQIHIISLRLRLNTFDFEPHLSCFYPSEY